MAKTEDQLVRGFGGINEKRGKRGGERDASSSRMAALATNSVSPSRRDSKQVKISRASLPAYEIDTFVQQVKDSNLFMTTAEERRYRSFFKEHGGTGTPGGSSRPRSHASLTHRPRLEGKNAGIGNSSSIRGFGVKRGETSTY